MAHNFIILCILKTKLSHAKYLPQTYFVLIKAKGLSSFQVWGQEKNMLCCPY